MRSGDLLSQGSMIMNQKWFGFFVVGFFLFILGGCFAYFVVFPLTFDLLLDFGVQNVTASISLRDYIVLASKALLFLVWRFSCPIYA